MKKMVAPIFDIYLILTLALGIAELFNFAFRSAIFEQNLLEGMIAWMVVSSPPFV
jgi:hypothetical protein